MPTPPWTADTLSLLATGYWASAALNAAVRLGVFDALDDGPLEARGVAARTHADAERLTSLLDALVAVRLLRRERDAYALADDARPLLSRSSPRCLLDALAYNDDLYRQWADLAGVVRGDAPAHAGRQLGGDPAMTGRFVRAMEAKARSFAPAAADAMDVGDARTLLDVGSGPGTLSRELLARHERLRVTLLDLPPVLDVARGINAASPVARRLAYHPADYRRDRWPGPFDAVLYAGALHQESAASARGVFAAACDALRPGGRLFVLDVMLDPGRTSPAFSALFQLNMLLLRPGARVFGVDEVAGLLGDVGFVGIKATEIVGTPYRLLRADRPG